MTDRPAVAETGPSVSVVIPTYNGGAWIEETLRSVFEQTQLPDEIIVVDDASTDDTRRIVSRVATGAPVPTRLIRLESNNGSPAPVLNLGIKEATGFFIAVIDQDDLILPDKLEQQSHVLTEDPELSFVFSYFCRYRPAKKIRNLVLAKLRASRVLRRMNPVGNVYKCDGPIALQELASHASANFFGGFPGFLFRRSAWERKGGFDESLIVASDFEFLCWLCTQGPVALIPQLHYWRREHGGNLTMNTGIRWRLDVINILLGYAEFRGTPDTPRAIRGSVRHQLWETARRLASAGHREAAGFVSDSARRVTQPGLKTAIQLLAIPSYVVYYKLLGRPWSIDVDQATEAMELSAVAVNRLG